jgi:hypothetical protein
MASVMKALVARQYRYCDRTEDGFIDETTCYVPFWYTKTGVILKWSLFLGFILFIGLYFLLGYLHAQSRIKKGLRPLAYHRFLVSRRQMAQVDPNYQYPQAEARPYFHNQQYFGMQNMPNMPPPPVYDPNAARPPMYPGPPSPPDGGSKVDPSQQQQTGVTGVYPPPAGPPPGAMPQQNTGSNPFRPL